MSDTEKKPTVQTRNMNGWIKGILIVGLVIIVIAVIAKSFGVSGISGFSGYTSKKDAYGWNLIETITCPMGKATWDKGRGWCTSQMKLEPGTYRLLLKEVRWETAFWDPVALRVIGYRSVPAQGISLSEWGNTPSYVRTFLKDAPVGSNRRFGSIVTKIGGQPAFDPFQKGSFEIEKATTISIGPNVPYCDNAHIHNRGVIAVEIEKEM